jgi:hypothetical protein
MIRTAILILVASIQLMAQPSQPGELLRLTDDLQTAITAGDWQAAAKQSASLRDAILAARNQALAESGRELTDAFLSWLPPDTETVIVAREPFVLRGDDQTQVPNALAQAQGYVVGLLGAVEKEELYKAMQGRTVRLAAFAARKFADHPPDEKNNFIPLGLVAYQGCSLYAFTEAMPPSLLDRPPDEVTLGNQVWISKGSQNDTPLSDTYLVMRPKPDLILICNDRDFFSQVTLRMAVTEGPRALPADLPEWKHVDRAAPLWAIRHFRLDRADVDPTYPAQLLDSGAPRATGMTLKLSPTGAIQARMLSEKDPWKKIAESDEFNGAAKSSKVADGVWELSVTTKPEAALFVVFALMAALGLAIYL